MLQIALPRGKSLQANVEQLFADARIAIRCETIDSLELNFPNFAFLKGGTYAKPIDVPTFVAQGNCDVGITGEDTVLETEADVMILSELALGRATSGSTKGVVFVDQNDDVRSISEIPDGSTICSEYPNLTRRFFEGRGKPVIIKPSFGTVEAAVPRLYRFGVTLSETGGSLRRNKKRPIGSVFESKTVLVVNKRAYADPKKRRAINALRTILCGALDARKMTKVSMNVPVKSLQEVLAFLPSMKSPTTSPLANPAYMSVMTVMTQDQYNNLVPDLLDHGAEDLICEPTSSVIASW